MHKWKLLLVFCAYSVYVANARPTIDVLYKIAENIGNELLSPDLHEHQVDPYRTHQPVYGRPSGSGYYHPHSHGPTHSGRYPAPYPTYPSPYPPQYQGPYAPNVGDPTAPLYPGLYPGQPPRGPYHPINYNQGPYDEPYPGQLESSNYGLVSGTNSYSYGGSSGYKQRGY